MTKKCSKCKLDKPKNEFCKDKNRKDGLNYTCKLCCKESNDQYYLHNKEKILKYSKQYKLNHSEYYKQYNNQYYLDNREKISKYGKQWRLDNLKKVEEFNKQYYLNNKKQLRKQQKEYANNKYKTDPIYKLIYLLRRRIYNALKNNSKSIKTKDLLGCTVEELKQHLESQFFEGITWTNQGEWHIDHVKPCSSFDMSKPEEQRRCFHYTNLQPLWAKDNLKKYNKIQWQKERI